MIDQVSPGKLPASLIHYIGGVPNMISKSMIWLCVLSMVTGPVPAEPDKSIPLVGVGHPSLSTDKLQFPNAVYYIRVKNQSGEWTTAGTFTEYGKVKEDSEKTSVERTQVRTFKDGKSYLSHRVVFDKKTLGPISTHRKSSVATLPKGFVAEFDLEYKDRKLQGTQQKIGADKPNPFPARELSQPMFEGDMLGLLLSALPLEQGYAARLPVMYSQMNISYWVVARVVGSRDFTTASGKKVRAWAVETDWHDMESDDVSPGGGSGGTYYVVPDPPPGYPHVPKYINDTFDTEVIPQLLPLPADSNRGAMKNNR